MLEMKGAERERKGDRESVSACSRERERVGEGGREREREKQTERETFNVSAEKKALGTQASMEKEADISNHIGATFSRTRRGVLKICLTGVCVYECVCTCVCAIY